MSKAKIKEKHTLSVEGDLIIHEDGQITISVEDIGTKNMAELLLRFNGETVKFNMCLSNDITE